MKNTDIERECEKVSRITSYDKDLYQKGKRQFLLHVISFLTNYETLYLS